MNNKKNNQQQQGYLNQPYGFVPSSQQQQQNQQEFPQSFIHQQTWPVQPPPPQQQNYGAEQAYNYPFFNVPQAPVENFQPPLPPSTPNQGNQQQNPNRNKRGQNRQNFGNRGNNNSNSNRGGNNNSNSNRGGNPNQQFHNQNSQGMNQDRGGGNKKRNERPKSWRLRDESEMQNWNQQQPQQYNRPPDQTEHRPNTRSQSVVEPPKPGPSTPTATLSKEEIEFDEQFSKWELEFTNWKAANVNHPDKEAYRQYEMQFEGVREKLLSRRNEMMKKKLEMQQALAIPKTAEQLKFESQWQAGPSTEAPKPPIVPPPSASKSSFTQSYQERFDDDDHYDDANYEMPRKSFAFIGGSQIGSNFDEPSDNPFQNSFPTSTHSLSIPGLDVVTREPAPPPVKVVAEPPIPVIDLDPENPNVPPMPVFYSNQPNRPLQDLKEILEEPGRSNRHPFILVVIRGPPGSGKSYIANLIMEKEIMHGNQIGFASLSIDKFIPSGPRSAMIIEKFQNKLLHELRNMVATKKYNFITIEVEGGNLLYFTKYSHVVGSPFKVYVIEIKQAFEACVKFNKNNRSILEIQETIEELKRHPTPYKVPLLDPTSLILSAQQNTPLDPPVEAQAGASSLLSNTTNIMHLLQDKNVLNLVQSQLKPAATPEPKSPTKAPSQPPMPLPGSSQQQADKYSASSQQKSFEPFLQPIQPDHRYQDTQNFQQNNPGFQPNNQNFHQGSGGGFHQGNYPQGGNSNFPQSNANFPRNNQDYQSNMSNYTPMNSSFQQNPGYSEDPQAGGSNQNYPASSPFDSCPTFTPSKIIDYKHVHMPTLSEQLMEFRVFRVIDYKHKSSAKIREYVKDIDPEKIKEKRKSVALRKKILEYLRSAEKPEDTVSNPKYPKNWEVVQTEEREKPGTKRGKRQTDKIRRVKVRKQQETAWMTKGYGSRPAGSDEEMELSDISSDDDFSTPHEKKKVDKPPPVAVEPKTPAIQQPPQLPEKENPNPLFTEDTTIPNFNAFNHAKVSKSNVIWPTQKTARRPGKILIILRGAPGSGKSHLTGLIKQKEIAMGFGVPRIVSINDYLEDEDLTECDDKVLESYMSQMVKFVERTVREGHHTFIIIDAENTDLSFYEKFHQAGASKEFAVFTIELQQKLEYCVIQNIHNRSQSDIERAIGELEKNRIPADHSILVPSELYAEFGCLVNKKIKGDPVEDEPKADIMDLDDDSSLEWIDLDNSTGQREKEFPTPIFNPNNLSSVVGLESLLELPSRNARPSKILIILRGPPGVGKSYLAGLILQREESMGNLADKISISIDNYFINPETKVYQFNQTDEEKNKAAMLSDLIANCQKFNFIVVDAENGGLKDYEAIRSVGVNNGFKCFAIEPHLDADTCVKQNIHNRTLQDILEVLRVINENPIPSGHECLDATYLYSEKTDDEDMEEAIEALPLKPALKLSEGVQIAVKKRIEAPAKLPEFNWHNRDHITALRSFLESPKGSSRIAIILRGAPGSGKSYLARLIERCSRDCGVEQFKCFSLEDFLYDDASERNAMELLKEELEVSMQEVDNKLIVVDADCCDHQNYMGICDIANQNNYASYTIEMIVDDDVCTSDEALKKNRMLQEMPTPDDHNLLDPEHLYEEYKNILDEIESEEDDAETSFGPLKRTTVESKWDDEGETGGDTVIERLDGTRNKTFERLTMANYLQTEDEWTMRPSQSGKKRVRWADIEEKKEQERMRDIGFIVGQTDWKRMTDTSDGKSALEKTKYIESRKNS